MRIGFQVWMGKVDAAIEAKLGVGSDDMPDAPYDVWHACGITPKAAAKKAIRFAGAF